MAQSDRDKWDAKYREPSAPEMPSAFLLSLDSRLPRRGRALDLAGGAGRHALWLAERGLEVTLADISPVALAIARRAADEREVPLATVEVDLDAAPPPPGPWDVLACTHFLWPPLWEAAPRLLVPGGWLVFEQPTKKNLQRHVRPGPQYLLEDGALPSLVQGLEVVEHSEGWTESGRHEARLAARRPVAATGPVAGRQP